MAAWAWRIDGSMLGNETIYLPSYKDKKYSKNWPIYGIIRNYTKSVVFIYRAH